MVAVNRALNCGGLESVDLECAIDEFVFELTL